MSYNWRDYSFKDYWMHDELERQNFFHWCVRKRVDLLRSLKTPEMIVEEEKSKLSLSLLQYELVLKNRRDTKEEYLRDFPEYPDTIAEIYKQFDLWYNSFEEKPDSVYFKHFFVEPWYVDEWCPWPRTEFHTLELHGAWAGRYSSAFDVCLNLILEEEMKKLRKELGDDRVEEYLNQKEKYHEMLHNAPVWWSGLYGDYNERYTEWKETLPN